MNNKQIFPEECPYRSKCEEGSPPCIHYQRHLYPRYLTCTIKLLEDFVKERERKSELERGL